MSDLLDPLAAAERNALAKLRQWWRHRSYENRRHLIKATTEWIRLDNQVNALAYRQEAMDSLRRTIAAAEAAAKEQPGYRADIDG